MDKGTVMENNQSKMEATCRDLAEKMAHDAYSKKEESYCGVGATIGAAIGVLSGTFFSLPGAIIGCSTGWLANELTFPYEEKKEGFYKQCLVEEGGFIPTTTPLGIVPSIAAHK